MRLLNEIYSCLNDLPRLLTQTISFVGVSQDCFKLPRGPWEAHLACLSHLDAYPVVGRIQTRRFQLNVAVSPAESRASVCVGTIPCFLKPWISPIVPPSAVDHLFCTPANGRGRNMAEKQTLGKGGAWSHSTGSAVSRVRPFRGQLRNSS